MCARFYSLSTKIELLPWHYADAEYPTYEHWTEVEIVRYVTSTPEASVSIPEPQENEEDPPPPKVSKATEASLHWLEYQEVDHINILQLRNILDFPLSKWHAAFKQDTLDNCFKEINSKLWNIFLNNYKKKHWCFSLIRIENSDVKKTIFFCVKRTVFSTFFLVYFGGALYTP